MTPPVGGRLVGPCRKDAADPWATLITAIDARHVNTTLYGLLGKSAEIILNQSCY